MPESKNKPILPSEMTTVANLSEPQWSRDFPISRPEEHKISRRELAKFLGMSVCACVGVAAFKNQIFPVIKATTPLEVAKVGELAIGESKLFKYPTEDHPAILIRLTEKRYVAYSQSCTHLMCPVHYDSKAEQIVCPCHDGFFDPTDGSVIAGPPPRSLPRFPVSIRNGNIFVEST